MVYFCGFILALFLINNAQYGFGEINSEETAIVLVPHGEDPERSTNRVVIPQAKDGRQSPLPCVVAGSGAVEHGQTFTKGSFHYTCKNGTAEVIACIADDNSVIQISRTFMRNGIRHRCNSNGETVTYEQRSTCYENGVHYDAGQSFRNGSFKLVCRETGVAIEGCYVQNSPNEVIVLGESRIIGNHKHSCEVVEGHKIRYIINMLGCQKGNQMYREGQTWTDKHIKYQCMEDSTTRALGCNDDNGLFVDLGRDVLMDGIVHRCYRVDSTIYYHRFQCDQSKSLQECLSSAPQPRRRLARSIMNINYAETS
ncbi:hypothetical protein DdX_01970 [Ditylenchus destructor]|uniref:Abnormal cell migration protein 18-like fibronectin type I domain-containing protein n=1 Tax=Ditylenchus destructor TaxID=166010 RepID=A0AAD4RBN2_9BILA|nr:hypothetical protein DdX_01970 [Ditylenchus destructor]